jgi:exodeoxyribonuclease VII small subunit
MQDITYESAMKRLEEIVEKLESGELSLEESIALYEESTKLSAFCADALNKAELKIKRLSEKENGENDEQ